MSSDLPVPPAPGVQNFPFFNGREPVSIVPGVTSGAEDLVAAVPLSDVISAGRPPVPPVLPRAIELDPVTTSRIPTASGRAVTRSSAIAGGDHTAETPELSPPVLWRVLVELEWGPLTREEWVLLRDFLLSPELVGLTASGAARAMTIDVDGTGLTDSAVEVRIVGAAALEQIIQVDAGVAGGAGTLYRFGPVMAEEVL